MANYKGDLFMVKNECPVCQSHWRNERQMQRFHSEIVDFLNRNRIVKLDSCTICIKKHVGRALAYYEELLTAAKSGTNSGEAKVNIPLVQLKIIGNLGCAVDESEDFPELFELLLQAERDYRYEGISPDWEMLARKIWEFDDLRQSKESTK